ncbi:MAG: oligosaccharide flippase family protein [Ignisphaera sp.]|nr:oligosaccharide flippase family protein [Ignisphaera sp.]
MDDSDVEVFTSTTRTAFILSIGDFIYTATLAIGAIAIARLLGSEGYGVYSLSFVVPLTLYSFINLGLDAGITRYTRLYLAEGSFSAAVEFARVSLFLKILIGFVGTVVCYVYAKPLSTLILGRPELDRYVVLTSTAVFLESLYTYLLSVFLGFEQAWRSSIVKIVYSISRTAIAVALLAAGFWVVGVVIAYIAGITLSISTGFAYLVSTLKQYSFRGGGSSVRGLSVARELLSYSLPLYAASLVSLISSAYQSVLLAYTLSNAEIGGYRALANLGILVSIVHSPIALSLLPMYTELSAGGGGKKLGAVLARSNRYVALVVVPLTLLSMVYSREVVYVVYGVEYRFASEYLPLLFAPFLLSGLGSTVIPQLFNAAGRTKLNMYVSLAYAAVFIPASYILTAVAGYKLTGFLTSNLIASTTATILYNVLLIRSFRERLYFREVAPIYISSALALPIPILTLSIPLPKPVSLLRIAIGGTLYTLAYIITAAVLKAVSKQDIEFITKALESIPIVNTIAKYIAAIAVRVINMITRVHH